MYSRASPGTRRVSGIVPRRRDLSMRSWLIERSHSHLVTASVLAWTSACHAVNVDYRLTVLFFAQVFVIVRTPTTSSSRMLLPSIINRDISFHDLSPLAIIILKSFYERKSRSMSSEAQPLQLFHTYFCSTVHVIYYVGLIYSPVLILAEAGGS